MKRMICTFAAAAMLAAGFASTAIGAGRRLQASDTIQVRVLNQPEFDTQARLSPDGTVSLPYLGRTRVAGRSEDDVARLLSQALRDKGVVNDPQVTVSTISFGAQVTVGGAVKTPGVQVLDRPTTLAEAIARSAAPPCQRAPSLSVVPHATGLRCFAMIRLRR